jgi:hypothetical protein
MITLANSELQVSLLDPTADAPRLGSRYVTGGYIWQVDDLLRGPLLGGAQFPDEPETFNGQGAPEVFQFTCYGSETEIPQKRVIIGVGTVENSAGTGVTESHWRDAVEEPAKWDVRVSTTKASFAAVQRYDPWHLRITRHVELEGRQVRSTTDLLNTGHGPLPFRWFAHPFFSIPSDLRCCSLRPGWSLEHNPGFSLGADGVLAMSRGFNWPSGHYELVRGCADELLETAMAHPLVGSVQITGDFPLFRIAVWANDRTFSIEPFRAASLQSGESARWTLQYRF